MKVLVNRLRLLMLKITKQNQASFVAGRNISDNIVMAQKTIHSMRTFKGRKMGMALKIDLEKAYNRVRWEFFGRYIV